MNITPTLDQVLRMVGEKNLPKAILDQKALIEKEEKEVKALTDALPTDLKDVPTEQKKDIIEKNKKLEEKMYSFLDDLEVEGIRLKTNRDEESRKAGEYSGAFDADYDLGHGGGSRVKGYRSDQLKSIGHRVMESKEMQEWCKSAAGTGRSAPVGTSPQFLDGAFDAKTLITGASSTSAGAFIITDRREMTETGLFFRPLTFLDLINFIPTNSDTLDYVEESSFTNAAAGVAEATSSADGLKPESAMAWVVRSKPVEIVAHTAAVTRNALSDWPRIRGEIDAAMQYGVREELEDLCIGGNGVTPNLLGLYNWSGVLSQAFDTDLFITYRKAITAIQRPGNDPTPGGNTDPDTYIMHPTDWENIELSYDNNQRYYYGGPSALGEKKLWGRRVVTSFAATAGSPILTTTRFLQGFVREGISIRMTDSHSDWFRRNIVCILVEGRFCFIVRRPAATALIATV